MSTITTPQSTPVNAKSGTQMTARGPLKGCIRVPGDKSISHRSLMFGALAQGVTRISGLLEADDVLRTAAQLRALGVSIEKEGDIYIVIGKGAAFAGSVPTRALYAGNAGTGVRLLMGLLAGQGIKATFDGDASLRSRPMGRVLRPLAEMGLAYEANDGKLPATIQKSALHGIHHRLDKPSAQVKSAILLAGLGAKGKTLIEEPVLCRDHTERMLTAFGVTLETGPLSGAASEAEGRFIRMEGGQALRATDIVVPADPSSAAFPIVAALITPGSDVVVEGVLMNEQRTGLYETLIEMGADITFENHGTEGGEAVADVRARYSTLKGIEVPAARAPSMIDEYPILSIAACAAKGETFMPGLEELRVKESDRLAAVEAGLRVNGVSEALGGSVAGVATGPDWMRVHGGTVSGGGIVHTHMDHRIAMSFLIQGLISEAPATIDASDMIATSFPNFMELMCELGASLN